MKKLYVKLSIQQRSVLSANAVHWERKEIPKKSSSDKKSIRTLFYKPNIKDY